MSKIEAPAECPVCSATLLFSTPETATDFAEWEYDCGAILHREDTGKLYCYTNCPAAMREAIDNLNVAPSPPQGQE